MAKPTKISGFPEWLPEQKIAEDNLIARIKAVYHSLGFIPIETPAVELLTTLGSKGVIDKEIFAVQRVHAQEGDKAELGLHFDLTVPLARYVAQHSHNLIFPFKRYQLQKVWRGDRPQKGRFREFQQFDIDIIGRNDLPLSCDAEVLSAVSLVMKEIPAGPYTIRINNRKLLSGIYGALGLEGEARKSAVIAVDKLLKIGKEGVAKELAEIPGANEALIESIIASTAIQCSPDELAERVASLGVASEEISQGIAELTGIWELVPPSAREGIIVDCSLARGLDYYTGLIVEVSLDTYPEFGTVLSGGRYDNLASEFTNEKLPGVGISVGLTRLMELLLTEDLIVTDKRSTSEVLVTVYDESQRVACNTIAYALRELGIDTEVYFKSPKLGKQIEYAEQKGIRYVLFLDAESGEMRIKDLVTKQQETIPSVEAWVAKRNTSND